MWLSWRARWRVYEYIRNSLWIVPLLFTVAAIALALFLPWVDEHTSTTVGISFGEDAARSVLGAIAGGMITFTGFVFSILLIAVQFGSSQFSPRLLRRFLRDPTTKASLGMFMASFMYALGVLRVVGTGNDAAFVPDNSISLAIFLLIASMLMFLRLLSRTTQGLRVASVLTDLGKDAREVMDRMYPDRLAAHADPAVDEPLDGGRPVPYSGAPGVVQSVDVDALVERARQADATIVLVPRFGELVDDGAVLFTLHGESSRIDDRWLQGTVATGDERTMRQDPAFAFRLFADISAKALSPGVNDPTTSVQALDQIELLLRQIASRRLTPGIGRDQSGVIRFRYHAPTWEDLLRLAVDETRQYGEGSIQVVRRLRALLENVRAAAPESRRAAVDAQLVLLDAAASRVFGDSTDRVAAVASDRQGLGATEAPGPPVPEQRAARTDLASEGRA